MSLLLSRWFVSVRRAVKCLTVPLCRTSRAKGDDGEMEMMGKGRDLCALLNLRAFVRPRLRLTPSSHDDRTQGVGHASLGPTHTHSSNSYIQPTYIYLPQSHRPPSPSCSIPPPRPAPCVRIPGPEAGTQSKRHPVSVATYTWRRWATTTWLVGVLTPQQNPLLPQQPAVYFRWMS